MERRGTNGRARGARRSQGTDLRVLKLVQKTAHRRDSGPGEPQPAFRTRIVHQQAESRGTIAAAGLEADAGFDELPSVQPRRRCLRARLGSNGKVTSFTYTGGGTESRGTTQSEPKK